MLWRLLAAARGGGFTVPLEDEVTWGPQPDRPPTVPHAYDDEFTSSDLSAWSLMATLTGYDGNTTAESCLYMETAPDEHGGLYKACPALPFRVTAKFAAYSNVQGGSVRSDVGMLIGEATPGKFFHGCLDIAEDNYLCIVGSKWTDPSTWVTNIGDFTNAGSGAGSRSRAPAFTYMRPFWVRYDVHSSSNVDGYFSFDGILYTKWLTAYNPGFTVGSVGFDMGAFDVQSLVAIDYVRFIDL